MCNLPPDHYRQGFETFLCIEIEPSRSQNWGGGGFYSDVPVKSGPFLLNYNIVEF